MMAELEGQHFIGKSFWNDDGGELVSIHDENGMWVLDCFESGAEEILKRINGYEHLEQQLHESMQELSELVTKREMVRRLQQTSKQLLEALEHVSDLCRFMCQTWSEIDAFVYENCSGESLMKYPVIQGTRNQINLAKIGKQHFEASKIPAAVEHLLADGAAITNAKQQDQQN